MIPILPTLSLLSLALALPAPTTNNNNNNFHARRQAPPATLTFSVANDVSGANAASDILLDGTPLLYGDAFANTALDRNGAIIATSAQLTTIVPGVLCVVLDAAGGQVGLLNEQRTFLELDRVAGQAVETDVGGFVMSCQI